MLDFVLNLVALVKFRKLFHDLHTDSDIYSINVEVNTRARGLGVMTLP